AGAALVGRSPLRGTALVVRRRPPRLGVRRSAHRGECDYDGDADDDASHVPSFISSRLTGDHAPWTRRLWPAMTFRKAPVRFTARTSVHSFSEFLSTRAALTLALYSACAAALNLRPSASPLAASRTASAWPFAVACAISAWRWAWRTSYRFCSANCSWTCFASMAFA